MMLKFEPPWRNYLREVKANRRLQYGLGAILLIILVNGVLAWSDRLAERSDKLAKLTAEIANLKRQSQNEVVLHENLAEVERIEAVVRDRLWKVSSEAVGQARLRDWLDEIVDATKLPKSVISLASPRGAPGTGSGKPVKATGLREFRATVSFVFSPEAVEQFLYTVEGAQPFVVVESLTLNRRDRRAEVGLRCLMWLDAGAYAEVKGGRS